MFQNGKQKSWANSWDYGTYNIGDQWRLRQACASAQSHQSLRFWFRTHEAWKYTKGPTKNQTSSPTGWLRMRIWRMSLRRTKSAIISWHGSNVLLTNFSDFQFLSYKTKLYNYGILPCLHLAHCWQHIVGPDHAKMCLMPYANNNGADQPAHPRSLISTIIVRCLDSIMPLVSISEISRL